MGNTISNLNPAPYNPRKITDKKLAMLQKSMAEFGDLSGIVCNTRTGHLVGGHQRLKVFSPDWPILLRAGGNGFDLALELQVKLPQEPVVPVSAFFSSAAFRYKYGFFFHSFHPLSLASATNISRNQREKLNPPGSSCRYARALAPDSVSQTDL